MSVAAAINILFGANTSAFDKAVAGLERKLGSLVHHVKEFGHIFEGLAHFLEPAFESMVQMAHVSERLEIPAEKLAGMQLAADAAHISFESLTGAMQKMMQGIAKVTTGEGEAATTTGKGPVAEALKQLGISAAELQKLDPAGQLGLIADKLKTIGDVGERVNIAKSLFGKGGVPMLNILEHGSKGLEQWQKAAEAAGLAFNHLDLSKVEEANKAITVMQASFRGLKEHIVVALAPAIEKLAAIVRWFAGQALDFWNKWGKVLTTIIEIMIAYRAVVWTIVAAEKAWATIKMIQAAIQAGSWAKLAATFAAITAAAVALKNILDKIGEEVKNINIPQFNAEHLDEAGEAASAGKKDFRDLRPGAFEKGSLQAYSLMVNAGATKADRMEGHARKQNGFLEKIEQHTRAIKPMRAANFGGR